MTEILYPVVFPTPVGMNRFVQNHQINDSGVPHTRGDEPDQEKQGTIAQLCSPHPWG